MSESFEEKLCSILVQNKVIKGSDASDLIKEFQGRAKERFDSFLLSENIVQKPDLLKALSDYYQVPSFDVVGYLFNRDLLLEFPQEFLVRHALIPLTRDENILVLVASRPDNEGLVLELAEYVSDEIQFFVGIRNDIVDAIIEYYEESPFSVDEDGDDEEFEDEFYEDEKLFEDVFEDSEE